QSNQAAILVSVDSIVGSTPREPGARMIVTEHTQIGTIGGGNLEFQATQIARDQLHSGGSDDVRRFPLGAGLGQCCGGLVNLMFERLDERSDWRSLARETPQLVLYLFGAGHVGQAIVHVLHPLPVQIKWIDTRDDILSTAPPNGVEFICTDTPESEVDAAHPGAWFLVMTHDHALDQRLAEQVLKRDDFDYFGLIGSHAKRRNFETRMARRGIDPETFSRMTCPIGIEGLSSKQPAQIAISVAAEILQVYDRLQKTDNKNPPIYGLEVNP
ncbi:MAG: xanthine dehydrogenase accessory protein XdhC, partial [Pseudomonadota bacterium]